MCQETGALEVNSQKKNEDPMQIRVVIVGAGAAGLSCASILVQKYGLRPDDLVILEARDRIGGRVWTSEEERVDISGNVVSFPVDFGAAWVHGTGLEWLTPVTKLNQEKAFPIANPMMDLLQQNTAENEDIYAKHLKPIFGGNPWMRPRTIVHDANQVVLFAGGQQVEAGSPAVKEALERHFAILRKVSLLGDDLFERGQGMDTVSQSLQETIASVVELEEFRELSQELSTQDQGLAKLLTPFYQHLIECWYGSPASELQLCEFTEDYDVHGTTDAEYTEEGDFYGPHCTLRQGMMAVLEPLLGNGIGSRVRLNEEVVRVTRLEPSAAGVRIETASGSNISASCCVVTMPAGCLQEAIGPKQLFEPSLSDDKIEAIQNTKMGCYKKVFLTFDRIFWPADEAFIGMVRGRPEVHHDEPLGNYCLFDNLWSRDGIPCIEAILFGNPAKWATHRSTEEVRDAVLEFMRDSMGLSDEIKSFCIDCHLTRWEEDPFSRGAYSSMQLGAVTRHVDELRRPEWGGKLLFCGEATISSYEGSVYASLFSAENAAKEVASYLDLAQEDTVDQARDS